MRTAATATSIIFIYTVNAYLSSTSSSKAITLLLFNDDNFNQSNYDKLIKNIQKEFEFSVCVCVSECEKSDDETREKSC